jgi:hypothetical protein
MGRYLELSRQAEAEYLAARCAAPCDKSDQSDKRYSESCNIPTVTNEQDTFGRFGRFGRTFTELERRCPAYVDLADWQEAVADARRFLAAWGDAAEALSWSPKDVFGLAPVPDNPAPSYRRLSRHDEAGLAWLLRGRPVVALTTDAAVIRSATGARLQFRRTSS